jgi:hypothetical protein
MKVFAVTLLAGAAAATEAQHSSTDHHTMNDHYDHDDVDHMHYGSEDPASPAFPDVPVLEDAVGAFDPYGTLFGEHRYQLQVEKTANMLIGTEALREAIAGLEERVAHAHQHVHENDEDIDENNSDIDDNRAQIYMNRSRLHILDDDIHELEHGYMYLHERLDIDRAALVMMCHQYAFASTIPDACEPLIGGLAEANEYQWFWPDVDAPAAPLLPPFVHVQGSYTKVTSDDSDDDANESHHYDADADHEHYDDGHHHH